MNIGDQVVCVETHVGAKKGNVYTIKDMITLSCGCVAVNVDIYGNFATLNCGVHNSERIPAGNYQWHDIKYFAPIQRDEFLSSDQIEKSAEEKIDIKLPETVEL